MPPPILPWAAYASRRARSPVSRTSSGPWNSIRGPRSTAAGRSSRSFGREEEEKGYLERAGKRWEEEQEARAERATLGFKDEYLEHAIAEEAVAALAQQLARYPEIARAYLVRKKLVNFPEIPLYVLGFKPRLFQGSKRKVNALRQRLVQELGFPAETYVVELGGDNAPMEKILKRIPGAVICPATRA